MIVLEDNADLISLVETVNGNAGVHSNKDKSPQSILEDLRHLPVNSIDQSQIVVKDSKHVVVDGSVPEVEHKNKGTKSQETVLGTLHVDRAKDWMLKTSAHVDKLLCATFPNPVSWLSFLLLILTGARIVFYYDNEKKKHIQGINETSNAVKQGPSVGQAAIGGPFNLVNHDGKSVTEKDFLGKWTMVYFGFTHCPDICPDELQKLAAAIDKIKKKAGLEIVPLFISVDPERDNVEQVCEYVKGT